MKYLDEYRDPMLAQRLVGEIGSMATRRRVVMDVCGGQTHSLLRNGIEEALAESVELIHGPGCPVCVTPIDAIDFAQDVAMRPDVILTSFGDMLRVPGSRDSLLGIRTRGGNVRSVYAPMDAVQLAQRMPGHQIVFLAVGFETTAPASALAVLQADRLGLTNFSVIASHVRVLPAMEALMLSPSNGIQGFLAAGHVCAVTGYADYFPFVRRFRVPVVVTGFEPIDLLYGIRELVRQLEAGRSEIENGYSRSVREPGNAIAQSLISKVYEVADRTWRGFGVISGGGLQLRQHYRRFDAYFRFDRTTRLPIIENGRCRSADVLAGRIKPTSCLEFGTQCRPDAPLGAPMVSSEGACAAYYRYRTVSDPPCERSTFAHVASAGTRSRPVS